MYIHIYIYIEIVSVGSPYFGGVWPGAGQAMNITTTTTTTTTNNNNNNDTDNNDNNDNNDKQQLIIIKHSSGDKAVAVQRFVEDGRRPHQSFSVPKRLAQTPALGRTPVYSVGLY